jgi:hypothetical protein
MPPAVSPPLIEPRDGRDFAQETESLLEAHTGWRPPPADPAWALVRVFARMAEVVADRINRTPEKSFLAFLDLLGVQPSPPLPARVPLTFALAAGSAADAVVPERTPVAAVPLEGEKDPVVFETERELVVTRSVLAHVLMRDPEHDRWADRSAAAAAQAPFAAFEGDRTDEHRLCIGHAAAFGADGPRTLVVRRPGCGCWSGASATPRGGTAWGGAPGAARTRATWCSPASPPSPSPCWRGAPAPGSRPGSRCRCAAAG